MSAKARRTTSGLKFRPPSTESAEAKGRKPLPEPTSVQHVLLIMVLHVCRKVIFVDTSIKVGIYGVCLFLISLIADVLPIPRTYFSRSDNVLNLYFVKLGWAWTLALTVPFIILTSLVYCCGRRNLVVKHLIRIVIATTFWYFFTKLFAYIETNYGRCTKKNITTKQQCLGDGHFWNGFDISGHAFILIYSNMVLVEEARAINGWEGIRDMIRLEDHSRAMDEVKLRTNPLKVLTDFEFKTLKMLYDKYTPYIRGLFISITFISILWDIMLVCTILYYHIMIEKFLSGAIAILIWFFTYRYWYLHKNLVPCAPGDGLFKYRDSKPSREVPLKKKASMRSDHIPRFMGMPLNIPKPQEKREEETSCDNDTAMRNYS